MIFAEIAEEIATAHAPAARKQSVTGTHWERYSEMLQNKNLPSMKERLSFLLLRTAALVAWWVSDHQIVPWVKRVAHFASIKDRDLSVLLAHWVFDQLPRVVVCIAVWLVGSRLGLMPSLRRSLASGGSWRRVVVTGLIATAIFLVLTMSIGAA